MAVEAVANKNQESAPPVATLVEGLLIDISPTSNPKIEFPVHQEVGKQVSVSPSRSIIDMPLEQGLYSCEDL